ncbi:sphingomyelin phosphodiesterase 1-like [Uranotaenia lowii]|uniref:sphingomyelin phosphodiesterase 1-like n=1 Tax=Uranotaenia lowii TaxID=190385 RepID=UPI00247A98DE|nr:sphingomyelin phosphodiesterase 1-like [Uranotaenia lowii]
MRSPITPIILLAIVYSSGQKINPKSLLRVDVAVEEQTFFKSYIGILTAEPVSEEYAKVLAKLTHPGPLELTDIQKSEDPKRCLTCRLVFNTLIKMVIAMRVPKLTVEAVGRTLCRLEGYPINVCEGIAKIYVHSFYYLVQQKPTLTADDFCRQLLADIGCSDKKKPVPIRKQIKISPKPLKSSNPKRSVSFYRVLHIGDIHMDQAYVVGAKGDCGSMACCRYVDPFRVVSNRWGDYGHCDQPAHAFQRSLEQMAEKHPNIDWIYLTGNIMHHHLWASNQEEVVRDMRKAAVVVRARRAFANVSAILALGNYDSHAAGLFAPFEVDKFGNRYLYKELKDQLVTKLYKKAGIKFNSSHEGYYTVRPVEGLKVIVLNNNVASIYNWWLLLSKFENFYTKQLQWLHDELLESETNQEQVHILAHLPAGSKILLKDWSIQYGKIVERFANTITGQFNGNTHLDEFKVFFDRASTPINVAWNAGSLAAYSGVNPNYRIYWVGKQGFEINEHETYYHDLRQTNADFRKGPQWKLEYRMKSYYSLRDLTPKSLGALIQNMATNTTLQNNFRRLSARSARPLIDEPCDRDCLRERICGLVLMSSGDDSKCGSILTL